MNSTQALLRPCNIGNLQLSNRMVMAPLTRSRADNPANAPTALHVEYYRQRASAGLIISEGSQVSKRAVGYINTAGIYSQAQIEGWKKSNQCRTCRRRKDFSAALACRPYVASGLS